ncbi:Uncharacterised protein [Mycobacteroides abscessus]|nr:Uncharacterised protein [Mycobacteroides abscessus]
MFSTIFARLSAAAPANHHVRCVPQLSSTRPAVSAARCAAITRCMYRESRSPRVRSTPKRISSSSSAKFSISAPLKCEKAAISVIAIAYPLLFRSFPHAPHGVSLLRGRFRDREGCTFRPPESALQPARILNALQTIPVAPEHATGCRDTETLQRRIHSAARNHRAWVLRNHRAASVRDALLPVHARLTLLSTVLTTTLIHGVYYR